MAKKKIRSPSSAAYFTAYKMRNTWIKNKIKKLIRHIKKQFDDKQAINCLKLCQTGQVSYSRNARKS